MLLVQEEDFVKRKLVLLLSRDPKPRGEKIWVVAHLDEDCITEMEDILEVYERPHDP